MSHPVDPPLVASEGLAGRQLSKQARAQRKNTANYYQFRVAYNMCIRFTSVLDQSPLQRRTRGKGQGTMGD
jgi:hypothetical protein